jgi:hypothetical protein
LNAFVSVLSGSSDRRKRGSPKEKPHFVDVGEFPLERVEGIDSEKGRDHLKHPILPEWFESAEP